MRESSGQARGALAGTPSACKYAEFWLSQDLRRILDTPRIGEGYGGDRAPVPQHRPGVVSLAAAT